MQIKVNMRSDLTARGPPHVVLLDMDGTLANPEGWWYRAETKIMADLGTTWSKKYVTQIIGSSLEYATPKTVADFRLPISPQELGRRLVSRVCEIGEASKVPWWPGAYGPLSLAVGLEIPTALVTSSYERFTHIVVKDAPPGSLTMIVAGDHGFPGKPDPTPYPRAAGLAETDPSSSFVIEDSMFGVRSGMAARARVVHVSYVVDVPPTPGLIKIDSLESVDGATLRRFMDGEHPQGDPYTDGAPNLRTTQRGGATGDLSDIRRKLFPSAAVLDPPPRAPMDGRPPFIGKLCWSHPFRRAKGHYAFLAHGRGYAAKGGAVLLEMASAAQPRRLMFEIGRVEALLRRVPYEVKLKNGDISVVGD